LQTLCSLGDINDPAQRHESQSKSSAHPIDEEWKVSIFSFSTEWYHHSEISKMLLYKFCRIHHFYWLSMQHSDLPLGSILDALKCSETVGRLG